MHDLLSRYDSFLIYDEEDEYEQAISALSSQLASDSSQAHALNNRI